MPFTIESAIVDDTPAGVVMWVAIALIADWLFAQPSAHGRVEVAIQVGLQAHVLVEWTPSEDRRFVVGESVDGFGSTLTDTSISGPQRQSQTLPPPPRENPILSSSIQAVSGDHTGTKVFQMTESNKERIRGTTP